MLCSYTYQARNHPIFRTTVTTEVFGVDLNVAQRAASGATRTHPTAFDTGTLSEVRDDFAALAIRGGVIKVYRIPEPSELRRPVGSKFYVVTKAQEVGIFSSW